MQIKNEFIVVLRILAVCLLFTVCMGVGVALSGLSRLGPQGSATQPSASQTTSQIAPAAPVSTQAPGATQPAPSGVFPPLLIYSLCVGIVASYLILRSNWHGWALAGAMFMAMYGISTVVNAIEAMFFSSGPLGTEAKDAQGRDLLIVSEPKEIAEFRQTIEPRDHRVFFDVLDQGKLGFTHGLVMKFAKHVNAPFPEGDFRDWSDIEAWANSTAQAVKASADAEQSSVPQSVSLAE